MCTAGPSEAPHGYGSGGTYESREVQAEYFLPLAHAEQALAALAGVCGRWGYDVFQITELRLTRGDDLWLSPVCDCHFSVQLNHFIPGLLSYTVPVFLK
jgi:hypothetical protein